MGAGQTHKIFDFLLAAVRNCVGQVYFDYLNCGSRSLRYIRHRDRLTREQGTRERCKKDMYILYICIAPHSKKKLTAETLRCGSQSFHTANTPHLPLPVTFHQRSPPV